MGDFLGALDKWWASEKESGLPVEHPFHGGWFIYLSYEMAAEVEPKLRLQLDTVLPRAFAVRCEAAVVRDHQCGKTYAISELTAPEILEAIAHDLAATRELPEPDPEAGSAISTIIEDEPARFLEAVESAKRYIAAGDIFQANLSRAWSVTSASTARDIYVRLAASNPAPFAGSVYWDNKWIISSSPERLLSLRDRVASTRPIAGTRPRAADPEQDRRLSAELIAHPKERAEHVMLIDLERNDLGRICEPGSVEVDEMMVVESYAHVHHIVSSVRGRLRTDVTPGAAIRAVFPGGTITGCPKVRCMQIIADLEAAHRGAYTGSFGYLNRDGSLDLNILIRTIVKDGGTLQFRAGAGIVADSDPLAELAETRAKARGLMEAFG
jgi:anthranilate synthase component 1